MTTPPSPPSYQLLYWPGLPGRGEHIRLCFEETKTPYTDVCNEDRENGIKALTSLISPQSRGDELNPPVLAPPVLKYGDVCISQTPNILLYLGSRLNLNGPSADKNSVYYVNQLALTALDGLSNEAHDTHHPVSTSAYYEEQKAEAKRKATDYTANRLPKFLGYFERVLRGGAGAEVGGGGARWLYGGGLTYADLVLWQCLDGLLFAFPVAMRRMRESGKYAEVFELYERVKARENIAAYLNSGRRQKYAMGIYRHYPELDA